MEDVNKILYIGASTFLFCIGIYLLFSIANIYVHTLKLEQGQLQENEIYQQNYSDGNTVTYTELVATLFTTLVYDIQINDILINKASHEMDRIEEYQILDTTYQKNYFYDSNGNITKIIYKSVS